MSYRFLLCFAVLPLALAAGGRSRPVKPVATPGYQAAKVNAQVESASLKEGAAGAEVLRAQILLDRAGFSVGEIDGRAGANMIRALEGLRLARGLDDSDRSVWAALQLDAAPALTTYTIAPSDLEGPFISVPSDMMAKSELDSLSYSSPLEMFGERFHSSPALLRKLNPRATFKSAGEQLLVPSVRQPRSLQAAQLVVSAKNSTVTALDSSGNVIAQYPCTSGSTHDPLPLGAWKVTVVQHDPIFHYNPDLFWDSSPAHSKAEIQPGPNNPVGLVWIGFSKEHYGIHGTPEPSMVGHTASHGCIRLTNWDALELAGLIGKGTPVTLEE